MKEWTSTARRRDLGMDLVAIREAAGFNGQELADALGWDQSKVSRLENGKQSIDQTDLLSWLITCDVKNPELRQFVARNEEAIKDTWVLPNNPSPTDSRNLIAEERASKKITTYACVWVPALLQTPGYTRALAARFNPDDEARVERIVAERAVRQDVMRGHKAPHLVCFIEEAVLTRPVGGRQVLHDQLMHLMFMADWTKISIRVLLTDLGEHTAGDGPFILFERRDKRSVAFLSARVTSVIFEKPEHIKGYQETVKDLAARALTEEESRVLIANLADESGIPREDLDGTAEDMA